MQEKIQNAIIVIKQGGIIIFPTDTAFGIGCRIDDEKAVKRLFGIKQRSETQATPVLVDSITMAQEYLLPIPEDVKEKLMDKYWPGALTIILQSRIEKVSSLVRGGTSTLGVRMPDHVIARALIKAVGVPLIGTSANFHGQPTPYTLEELDKELIKQVDFVLPGMCKTQQPSTVIDCSQNPWKVLREGAVNI